MGFLSSLFGGSSQTEDLSTLQNDPQNVIIDVRTPAEFREGHVRGARNIDVSAPNFKQHAEKLDRSKNYYLYCRSGSRSGMAAGVLKNLGFEQVTNLGGFGDLARRGLETTT